MPVNISHINYGWKAKNFELKSVNEKIYSLKDLKGPEGTVIVFICNHCPYVKAIVGRLRFEAKELFKIGIHVAAIMPNDVENYPEDSFENMKKFSKFHNFNFPYLYDEYQEVAKKYNAICTPDFFGFNNLDELQYRGRIDSGMINSHEKEIKRELYEAMKLIISTGKGPINQNNSIGCYIKWKK
jgi:peroxiredoxin